VNPSGCGDFSAMLEICLPLQFLCTHQHQPLGADEVSEK
jgi:hypothetical protein